MNQDDFPTLLRDRLHRAADSVDVEGVGPENAVARARTRQRTRRATVAGFGAVLLLALGVATLTDRDDRTSVATEPDVPAGQPVELAWSLTDDGLSNLRATTIDPSNGATYALSTAPGVRDTPAEVHRVDTVYRLSEDGRWEPTTVGDDAGVPARLAADGGLLYAIGTSSRSGGLATVVSSSPDGGATWSETVLREVAPPNDSLPWRRLDNLDIAAAGGRQVAIASSAFYLDWNEILDEPTHNSWIRGDMTDDGVRLVRETSDGDDEPMQEEIGFRTWEDLDVSGPEVFDRTTSVWVADGGTWTEVDAGLGDQQLSTLRAVAGRFVMRSFQDDRGRDGGGTDHSWVSEDGRSWSEVAGPGATGALPVGDRFVGMRHEDGRLVQSTGDGVWTEVDLGSVDERLAGGTLGYIAAGDLGLALTVHGDDPDDTHVVFTPDLGAWTVVPVAEILGEDAPWPSGIDVGADRIVIIGTDNGAGPGPARTVTAVGVPRR